MIKEKKSLFHRIRSARKSLENAEKSFQDDQGMRGELDLMLAEAELKNLRSKQAVPWNWTRHTIALSVAVLLVISGVSGWLFAKDDLQRAEAVLPSHMEAMQQKPNVGTALKQTTDKEKIATDDNIVRQNINTIPDTKQEVAPKVRLSDQDVRNLVRQAKSELSGGK